MRDNSSAYKLYIGFAAIFLLLSASFIITVFIWSNDWKIRGAVIAFTLLFLLLAITLIFMLRKELVAFSVSLSNYIDSMITGKRDNRLELEAETLTAKLGYRLGRLYDIVQNNISHLQSEKELLQEMVSDISHQVKTPMTNLKMYNSTLLEQQIPAEKVHEFLLLMNNQINKLDFLMQSMVKMSRLETGMITLTLKPLSIYDTIALSLGGIVLPAEQKNIEISVECAPSLIVLHDQKWTAEALFNILDNAVKYTGQGGRISITVERWEAVTKIDIADNGKGIPEQHHSQIFKRFYREEDVREVEGVGLGLYLCCEIISRQGGYIQVKSEPGKGSVFAVFLRNG